MGKEILRNLVRTFILTSLLLIAWGFVSCGWADRPTDENVENIPQWAWLKNTDGLTLTQGNGGSTTITGAGGTVGSNPQTSGVRSAGYGVLAGAQSYDVYVAAFLPTPEQLDDAMAGTDTHVTWPGAQVGEYQKVDSTGGFSLSFTSSIIQHVVLVVHTCFVTDPCEGEGGRPTRDKVFISPKALSRASSASYNTQNPEAGFDPVYSGNGKELPDNSSSTGWMDMTANSVLLHFNELIGKNINTDIGDTSGTPGMVTFVAAHDGIASTEGLLYNGLRFDGESYVEIGDQGVMPAEGTVAFWFKLEGALLSDYALFSTHSLGNQGIKVILRQHELYAQFGSASATELSDYVSFELAATDDIQVNTWYHVAIRWERTTIETVQGYVNGIEAFDEELTDFSLPSDMPEVTLGSSMFLDEFEGVMDEFALWARQLSVEEIQTMFNTQSPVLPEGGDDGGLGGGIPGPGGVGL